MSLLSYKELVRLVEDGVITNVVPEQINASSIDLTLGRTILIEVAKEYTRQVVSLRMEGSLIMEPHDLEEASYLLAPQEFILAHTQQSFNLPNDISAEYKLKSSMARIGLEHLNSGWCDAGWNGSVMTLELLNVTRRHNIVLSLHDPIGQVVFFRHEEVPEDRSYAARGRYNGDETVSGVKFSPAMRAALLAVQEMERSDDCR
jgi:deoxycytidine triphosphate deaminase